MSRRLQNAFWRIILPGGIFVALIAGFMITGRFSPSTASPKGLTILYATPSASGAETLWASTDSAEGVPQENPIRLGHLGLVAQAQIATWDARSHSVLVTMGSSIRAVFGSRSQLFAAVPSPWTVLSIRWLNGVLYAVAERPGQSHASVWTYGSHVWRVVTSQLPEGIITLLPGPEGIPTAFIVDPHHAYTVVLQSNQKWEYPAFSHGNPQGTVAFSQRAELIPYAQGAQGFGQWTGYPHSRTGRRVSFAGAGRAVIEVTAGDRLWGIGAYGMIPYDRLTPRFGQIERWPMPMQTTVVAVGLGKPWLVVLDGPAQGLWFNTDTGHFGPHFTVNLPSGDVVRGVAVKG